jgi:anti-sigma factor RsiW
LRLDRELTCAEVVELVTAYPDDRLSPEEAQRFEEHLVFCDGCSTYLEQMQATIAATGELRGDDIPSVLRDRLLQAFRDWSRA